MGYAVGSVIDVASFRTKIQSMLESMLPSSGYRDSTSAELYGVWASYLTTRAQFITDLMAIYDSLSPKPTVSSVITAQQAWNVLYNIFLNVSRCRAIIWDDLGAAAPGDQRSPQTRANEYTNAGTAGGTWTYFKASFSWNTTQLNVIPAPVDNADSNVNGVGWWPATSTNWNNNVKTNPGVAQPSALKVSQIIALNTSIENTITSLRNEWNSRSSVTTWWNGSTASQSSNRILCVKYWCHTNCHNNCHSNCHGSRSRR